MLYHWHGKEEPLGASIFTAQSLIISIFDEVGGRGGRGIEARGSIGTMDYAENCDSTWLWVARGNRKADGTIEWDVQHDTQGGRFSSRDESGRPMFTVSRGFDNAIETFIKKHLGIYVSAPKDARGVVKIEEPAKIYQGPKAVYKGPCICGQLFKTNEGLLFSWRDVTGGGQFPQRCFTCSCGRNWWNYDSEQGYWGPVPDTLLFSTLMDYNGEPQKPISVLEDGFYLVQTLRNRGLIPIG